MYVVIDPISYERFEFEEEAVAQAKAEEIRLSMLDREDYRFTVAKEVIDGNNTTWMNADLDNDPEDNGYFVFNTFTGQHEKVETLSAARARKAELKAEFADSFQIVPIVETPKAQPISQGAQTL